MNRREFFSSGALAAAGAALAGRVPWWGRLLPASIATSVAGAAVPRDPVSYLAPFCLQKADVLGTSHDVLTNVLPCDGHQWASDGRVLCRVRQPGARLPEGLSIHPENLPWDDQWYGAPFRMRVPGMDKIQWEEPCAFCQESVGPPIWEREFCIECNGTGKQRATIPVDIPHGPEWCQRFNLWYLKLAMELPGVTFQLANGGGRVAPHRWVSPVRFTWEHGDGLIMPMVSHGNRLEVPVVEVEWCDGWERTSNIERRTSNAECGEGGAGAA